MMRVAVAAALLALAACGGEKPAETPVLADSPLADAAALQQRAIAEADADVRAAEAAEVRASAARPAAKETAAAR